MEAFVYCWYNQDTKKKYIGYHKGNVDDGYVSSSCNDRFWKDYNEGKMKKAKPYTDKWKTLIDNGWSIRG